MSAPITGEDHQRSDRMVRLLTRAAILRELLRTYQIEAVRARPESLRPRGIINAPSHGSQIRVRPLAF
jgi:hypothetical protein